ncbi:MAG: penicillin-binding protein 2, partial [Actinomycetaceae bacterium]|nr:penicillin-binding protein 2 [Actinomycetaceae bacterium]
MSVGSQIAGVKTFMHAIMRLPRLRRRTAVVILIFLIGFLFLFLRLFYLQVLRADTLADSATDFHTHKSVEHGKRGDILDSKGEVLATTIERYNVGVDQKRISNYVRYDSRKVNGKSVFYVSGTGAAAAAEELAPILNMDRAELGGLLLGGKNKSTFVYIARDISPETWREIQRLGITGIEPEQYMKRVYPNGNVAGNVLGFIGKSDESPDVAVGQMGIEATQEEILAGKDGETKVQIAPTGVVLPSGETRREEAVDGSSVRLTIDRDLQNSLMQAVDSAVERHHAQWGAAVVVEVGTGRVLALVDSNSPDPGNLEGSPEDWGSRAVQAPVEPGSTGKLITFSTVLEKGTVDPYTVYTVPYEMTMPNGESFHNSTKHETEQMTVAGILAKSYNTGMVQIGDTVDDKTRYEYLQSFGIGRATGIELPAESAGLLKEYDQWDNRTRYTTMFGQGWAATTVQRGQMAATIANGGVEVPLHIIDSTIDPDGVETPTVVGESRRVVSEETATTMLQMMQGVTQKGGTAPRGAIEGYNVAGKTGTAQVADENGRLTRRVSSFIGIVPAEDPQIAVAVVVYGASGAGYGGDVAAPVFKDVGT